MDRISRIAINFIQTFCCDPVAGSVAVVAAAAEVAKVPDSEYDPVPLVFIAKTR